MSTFTFIDAETGKEFKVKGAAGLTESQALDIFNAQKDKGGLVNLKPGDVLSAVSQAKAGLTSALSQVSQAAAGIAGSATGALGGALNKVTEATKGLTSATTLSSGLSGALGQAQSVASKTLSGISSAAKVLPPTQGIAVSNFAKQATALMPIADMTVKNVTATLAQSSKLVGQASDSLSSTLGLGKHGLDCAQLETAGYVKPGTAAKYIASGVSNVASTLSSPAVWTGKGGINDATSLLSSPKTQDLIQQGLMKTGLTNVAQMGIPVSSLNPSELAGTALNAAKSATDTLKWAAGKAETNLKSAYDTVARNAAFAVDFSKSKIDSAMSSETVPPAVSNTVDRASLNAATTRIIGNKKIPAVSYEEPKADEAASTIEASGSSLLSSIGDTATSALASAKNTASSTFTSITSRL